MIFFFFLDFGFLTKFLFQLFFCVFQMPLDGQNENNSKKKKNSNFGMFNNNSISGKNTEKTVEEKKQMELNMKTKKQKIHFKFNQGFSNAVRRPVKITEFL